MRIFKTIPLFIIMAVLSGCGDTTTEVEPVKIPDSSATSIRVPQDASTIQAAIDYADNFDTVLVADGTYQGDGNRDIDFKSKSIILRSENGPANTIIDCAGSANNQHCGLIITGRANDAAVDGFTIKNGYINSGGGLRIQSSSITVRNCVIAYNVATTSGGGVWCKGSDPAFINCTFVGNSSMAGGAIFVLGTSSPTLTNCIVAFSEEGGGIYSNESSSQPTAVCCNVFDNLDGNYAGSTAGQSGINGNIELDPQFCNPESGEFGLQNSSPCLPANNGCGILIGALQSGCR